MGSVGQLEDTGKTRIPPGWPSNDNQRRPAWRGRSIFPHDAFARIYKPSRSVKTSGKARTKGWRLAFERRTAPFIEPLMGYTGGDDTLTQVELSFPSLEAAIRYAEQQGLAYAVQAPTLQVGHGRGRQDSATPARGAKPSHAFSVILDRPGHPALQERYSRAIDLAANGNHPSGAESWPQPVGAVHDPALTLEAGGGPRRNSAGDARTRTHACG